MNNYTLKPAVDPTQEFIEIAYDFSNPLDIVREAISNAFDAKANEMSILFTVKEEFGEKVFVATLSDNGTGMDRDGLQSFFDLGNSLRREDKEAIGEKGHGTKVYLNSDEIIVNTVHNGIKITAVMKRPKEHLFDHKMPIVEVKEIDSCSEPNGTKIIVKGYNNNRRGEFTHARLKDYIQWFTKVGSIEHEFGVAQNTAFVLNVQGVDSDIIEKIPFGHTFPPDSDSVDALFEQYLAQAPKWYCKKIIRSGHLANYPEIKYDAVFSVEGNLVKYHYNPMIRRRGYGAPKGAYTVEARYGLWLCKDYIPIQRKNDWIISKGSEYTRFHAFINCQDLKLTANRGSIDNTPSEILEDIHSVVTEIYKEIVESSDWQDLNWLENQAEGFLTKEREEKDFKYRINRAQSARVCEYKGVRFIEPYHESGVFSLCVQIEMLEPDLFPFVIIDYDTHQGIDVIVKEKDSHAIVDSRLYYLEFKYYLEKQFNHSFENLHSIVCWDIDPQNAKNGDEIEDISGERRILKIVKCNKTGDYTRYFLDGVRSPRKIEIFVLKSYLEEKLGLIFKPRTSLDVL